MKTPKKNIYQIKVKVKGTEQLEILEDMLTQIEAQVDRLKSKGVSLDISVFTPEVYEKSPEKKNISIRHKIK